MGLEDGEPSRSLDADMGVAAKAVLLASEGRPISLNAVTKAAQLAVANGAKVHVLSVARIWGTAFGLQHPGLFPTSSELQIQRDIVSNAIDELKRAHVDATGEVLRSRNAAKAIAAKTHQRTYLGIVMTADAEPHWLIRGVLWSHEPYRVRRLAKLPVHLVVDAAAEPTHNQASH
jgi:nucleotide-binding universal stress UspA family protein